MDLPRRIVDGGAGDWERSVLASASLDQPSPELRVRLRQELGLAVGAGLAATAVTSKSLGAIGFKWTIVGLLIGVAGAAGLSGLASQGHAEAMVARVASTPIALAVPPDRPMPVQPAAASEPQPDPEPATATAAASPSRTQANGFVANAASPADAAAPKATGPIGSAQFASPTESELAAQLAAIRSVRAALASNQAPRALREVDAYEHAYPAGLLVVEAEVLRIDANAALGNRDAVTRLGRDFLGRHPASPYARHVQSLLDPSEHR